ncbi:MAG: peroxide-responsive transcriptional repressor PerR [Bacilli bacterium]
MGHALAEAIEKLKENGVRITPQRQAILEFIISAKSHPTADEIYRALESRFPSMSVATVYNNLKVFKELHLVKELTYGDASSRFDFITHDHYHVICEVCDRIVDFTYPALNEIESLASHMTGFEVTSHRLELYGVCPDCQAQK